MVAYPSTCTTNPAPQTTLRCSKPECSAFSQTRESTSNPQMIMGTIEYVANMENVLRSMSASYSAMCASMRPARLPEAPREEDISRIICCTGDGEKGWGDRAKDKASRLP